MSWAGPVVARTRRRRRHGRLGTAGGGMRRQRGIRRFRTRSECESVDELRRRRSPTRLACAPTGCRTTPTPTAADSSQARRAPPRSQQHPAAGNPASLPAPTAEHRPGDQRRVGPTVHDGRRLSPSPRAAGADRGAELRAVHALARRAELA